MACSCKNNSSSQPTKIKQVVKNVRKNNTTTTKKTDSSKRLSVRQIRYRRPL